MEITVSMDRPVSIDIRTQPSPRSYRSVMSHASMPCSRPRELPDDLVRPPFLQERVLHPGQRMGTFSVRENQE